MSNVDRQDPYYQACVVSSSIGGLAIGSFVPVLGSVAGLLGGFATGFFLCPLAAPAIRWKFEKETGLNEVEFAQAVRAMRYYAQVNNEHDAIKLLAAVRARPVTSRPVQACTNPRLAGIQILQKLT